MKIRNNLIWGKNKFVQTIKEHDKLECGNGWDRWITHVLWDKEKNKWHREEDYLNGFVVGNYS